MNPPQRPSLPSHSRRPMRATYRLQFHREFTLRQARALLPYLRALGVSHVYASPWLKARAGSRHGYDVCDAGQLNPEIGTEADLAEFMAELHARDLGLVLDLVPNHMGIGGRENAWWWDVLKHGRASRFARHFDIDWNSPDPRLHGKVLVPVLGERYHRLLETGELQVEVDQGEGVLRYHEHRFPLDPDSLEISASGWDKTLRQLNTDPETLDALLQQQHYRLTYWRHGDHELNYRRFFNITTLAGVRVEDAKVFADTHALIHEWYGRGFLDGLRIDHPDGLQNPEEYLHRLHRLAPGTWIVIEKILEPGEALPGHWPVAGTTGYDFLNQVGGLFIARESEKALTDFYAKFTGAATNYAKLVRQNKLRVLDELLDAEVGYLTRLAMAIAARHWRYRDLTPREFRAAISEVAADFPVYRTYTRARSRGISPADARIIREAMTAARQHRPDLDPALFACLEDLLHHRLPGRKESEFALRFQQLTGPAMAKGVEDTTFYGFNRLVALNEVGGHPGHFGTSVAAFHEARMQAAKDWPQSMLASSTHDTKRSEDVRARLSVLSEIPEAWMAAVRRWSEHNAPYRRHSFPDRNAEYLYYQTLAGAWPLSADRALAYMQKAACEAKEHTSWTGRHAAYEEALAQFVTATLNDREFVQDLEQFIAPLLEPGQINSLAQTLLKLTAPGVPDIYQGTELWDLSLVDPDNRRPVDYALRQRLLDELDLLSAETAWQRRAEGVPKLWLIQKTLGLRREHPEWFGPASDYQPIPLTGAKAQYAIAFLRGGRVATVVPRLTIARDGHWADTQAVLPAGDWRQVLTGDPVPGGAVAVENLLARFPVALLARTGEE